MSTMPCLKCGTELNQDRQEEKYWYECNKCNLQFFHKKFFDTGIEKKVSGLSEREKANIRGYLHENPGIQQIDLDAELGALKAIPTPSFHERADKLLKALEKMTNSIGKPVALNYKSFQTDGNYKTLIQAAYCIDDLERPSMELDFLIKYLSEENRIVDILTGEYRSLKILPAGWAHLEKLKEANPDSQQGFVAMWFDPSMNDVFEKAIAPAIENAGYKPHRVDKRDHNDKIDDEIVAQIRQSRFVVADFTGHRGGVYFEAGFAKGLGLEVFWTCSEDEFDKIHFDIRQYNTISWKPELLEEFKTALENRIVAVLGKGTYKREKKPN